MDSNDQYLEDSEYFIKRSLEIHFDYAIDGELQDKSIDMTNDPSGPVALNEEAVVIAIADSDFEILRAFNLQHITYYIASVQRYRERMCLLDNLWEGHGLQHHRTAVLVLMVRGYWGIAVTENAKNQIRAWKESSRKTLHSLQIFHDLNRLKGLFEDEEHFRSVGMNPQEAANPVQYMLRKVTFEFQAHGNSKAKKLRIAVQTPQQSSNPIASGLLRYLDWMSNNPQEFSVDLNLEGYSPEVLQRRLENPHFFFCYSFIQFLDRHTNLNRTLLRSRSNQFIVYETLLRNAGFSINTNVNIYDNSRSNLEKWYSKGKRLHKKIYRT